jgi:DNA-binding transcriptional LysR family regulator
MAEVLKKLVLEGEGVAWLPKSSIVAELDTGELVLAGRDTWNLEVELRAYRDASNRNEFLDALWRHLRAASPAVD